MKAVVLAAGASVRARGCKALFACASGETYVERAISTLFEAGAREIVVVLARPWAPAITRALGERPAVRLVESADPEGGMRASVKAGLASLGALDEPVVVALVDHPGVRSTTVRALVGALGEVEGGCAMRPRFGARHGHPIAVGPALARALATDGGGDTLRDAIARLGVWRSIEVSDPAVLEDLDGPTMQDRPQRCNYAGPSRSSGARAK